MKPGFHARPTLQLHHPGIGPALPPTAEMLAFLDVTERRRADRYATPARATGFIAGRYLLRVFAADLVDADPRALVADFSCPVCGRQTSRSDHGRPGYLLDGERLPLALSLSRAAGAVLLGALDIGTADPRAPHGAGSLQRDIGAGATGTHTEQADVTESADTEILVDTEVAERVGAEGGPEAIGPRGTGGVGTGIGVDVDAVSGVIFDGFDDVALSQAERDRVAGLPSRDRDSERARLWVRKEALVKALGTGFNSASPADMDVLADPRITDLEDCDGVGITRLGLVAAVAVV